MSLVTEILCWTCHPDIYRSSDLTTQARSLYMLRCSEHVSEVANGCRDVTVEFHRPFQQHSFNVRGGYHALELRRS